MGTSLVTKNNGESIELHDLLIPAEAIYNFVMLHSEVEAFDGMSLQACLEYIVKRGKAEIERSERSKGIRKENDRKARVVSTLQEAYGLSIDEAFKFVAKVRAEEAAAAAKAKSAANGSSK